MEADHAVNSQNQLQRLAFFSEALPLQPAQIISPAGDQGACGRHFTFKQQHSPPGTQWLKLPCGAEFIHSASTVLIVPILFKIPVKSN